MMAGNRTNLPRPCRQKLGDGNARAKFADFEHKRIPVRYQESRNEHPSTIRERNQIARPEFAAYPPKTHLKWEMPAKHEDKLWRQ